MKKRLARFQEQLTTDAAIIDQVTDLFYLTGLKVSRGVLVVGKREATLFVDGRYIAEAKEKTSCAVQLLEGDAPWRYLKEMRTKEVTFDSAATSVDLYLSWSEAAGEIALAGRPKLLKELRAVKDPVELAALKKAEMLTFEGYRHVAQLLKEGVSEEELACEFECYVRKRGASGFSFDAIIAFGENSAYPHHRAGKTKLKKNQIVLIDVGAIVDSYRGDLTRIHFFGKADPELEKMLHVTKRAQERAIQMVRPGVTFGELDLAARSVFKETGMEELFSHGLGHGIGLETHEFPSLKNSGPDREAVCKVGMVFTVEPGLYRPGLGGVRWEDMVVVTQTGCETLC
jgi:Xaa-Pro aminopeptidase